MHVIGCQLDIAWHDKPANHAKVRTLLERAHPPRDALVVLPEMFATGFSMNVAAIADDQSRETTTFLSSLAKEFQIHVLAGIVTSAPAGKGRNEAVAFDSGGREIGRYCKMHPFTFGGEREHYAAGDAPVLFQCGEFLVAPFVCYDLRFPEAFRAAVRQGAQLFVVIANWPAPRAEHWTTLLRARAIENQACVVGVNRCGRDPENQYAGGSLIVGPRGEVLAEAGDSEGTVSAELDLPALLAYRREFPALSDIRSD